MHRLNDRQRGFTIIEVLIVLAIGGLILSIVFLAIPTLQRNGQNNQRKQDVAGILEGVSRWGVSNNSGEFPNDVTAVINRYEVKLTFYDPADISFNSINPPASQNPLSGGDVDKVKVFNYQKCDPNQAGRGTIRGAGYSDVVALYTIKTSDGNAPQCKQL